MVPFCDITELQELDKEDRKELDKTMQLDVAFNSVTLQICISLAIALVAFKAQLQIQVTAFKHNDVVKHNMQQSMDIS